MWAPSPRTLPLRDADVLVRLAVLGPLRANLHPVHALEDRAVLPLALPFPQAPPGAWTKSGPQKNRVVTI